MSRNLETIFLPPAPKMYNNVDKSTILMTKMEFILKWIINFVDNSGKSLTNLT